MAGEAEDDVRVIWDVRGWGRATERTKERREGEINKKKAVLTSYNATRCLLLYREAKAVQG